ncbi:MAG: helix-turn-helix domain-containing protein [Bacteroidetes bacterium]|nr:helix-turn-helix domain-containing protein [Bacteroidota bacterium]
MQKHISILVPEGEASIIDIIGSYKAFSGANRYLMQQGQAPMFEIQTVGYKPQHYDGGIFTVTPQVRPEQVKHTDLVLVPAGGWNFEYTIDSNQALLPWIVQQYKQGAEVASMCIGGFLLAATGLLNGRSCSTHYAAADVFRRMFPEVHLQTDKIITDEQGIYTNGGAMSFANLLVYLLEKYCGRECAIYCAKFMQVDIDRSSQSPFIMFSGLKDHQDEAIKQAQAYLENNLAERVNFATLAEQLGIGRRNFDRRFVKATTITPVLYQQQVRVEAAKKLFETSRRTVSEVMYEVGYNDMQAFREVFKKITGLSPLDYRNKYNKETAAV